jgi:transcriptional regulator with XRE-family HTH domain
MTSICMSTFIRPGTDWNVVELARPIAISQWICDNDCMTEGQQSSLGRIVRQEREARGWSQFRLAKEAGCNGALISRIETGEALHVTPTNLQRIAEALGLPSSQLMAAAADRREAEVLPTFRPYLRRKYGELPPSAHRELESQFEKVLRRYGGDGSGPGPGEDEKFD